MRECGKLVECVPPEVLMGYKSIGSERYYANVQIAQRCQICGYAHCCQDPASRVLETCWTLGVLWNRAYGVRTEPRTTEVIRAIEKGGVCPKTYREYLDPGSRWYAANNDGTCVINRERRDTEWPSPNLELAL